MDDLKQIRRLKRSRAAQKREEKKSRRLLRRIRREEERRFHFRLLSYLLGTGEPI